MKTSRAQIEMVDWAFVRRRLELLLLITEAEIEEFGEEEEEELKSMFFSTMAELSSGKKTRRRPIPQLSLELFVLEEEKEERVNPIRNRFGFSLKLSQSLLSKY
jgi:hypothetical protein